MNPRQRKFVKLWLTGMPAGRAYEKAGYEVKGSTADVCGSQLLKNPKVKAHINKMNEKAEKSTIKTVKERKEMLSRIMDKAEDTERLQDAIRASAELSKMDGAYEHVEQLGTIKINIGGDDKAE